LSIARLQSYSPADLKHIIMVFWNFHHTRSSTQGIPVQRKPIWQLDVHLSTIVLSSCLHRQNLIIMLQYGGQMGYKYESLPTRKDRYTLLLESPFLILLKCTNCCLYGRIVSLMQYFAIVSLNSLTHEHFKKRERQQKLDPHKLSFPEGTTSLHIEYKVACMCRCSMQCLLSVFINYS